MIESVRVSAPITLNIGGAWDLTHLIGLNKADPLRSVTCALDHRVEFYAIRNGTNSHNIQYSVEGAPMGDWQVTVGDYDYSGMLGMLYAVLSHCELPGLNININVPVKLGVGLGVVEAVMATIVQGCFELIGRSALAQKVLAMQVHRLLQTTRPYVHYGNIMSSIECGVRAWQWQTEAYASHSTSIMAEDKFSELEELLVIAVVQSPATDKSIEPFAEGCLNRTAIQQLRSLNTTLSGAINAFRLKQWPAIVSYVNSEQAALNAIDTVRTRDFETYAAEPSVAAGAFGICDYGQATCWFMGEQATDADAVRAAWEGLGATILTTSLTNEGLG